MKKLYTLMLIAFATITLTGCSLFKKTDTTPNDTAALETVPAQGATVSVDYVGTLEDGTIFDTSLLEEAKKAGTGVYSEARTYAPLTFTVGESEMIAGFEQAVIGMKKGDTKTVTIPTDQAYGEPKQDLLFTTGVVMFTDAGITPVIGESYNFGGAPGKVVALSGGQVTLDFNHPLAGKALTFKITVVDIVPAIGTAGVPTDEINLGAE